MEIKEFKLANMAINNRVTIYFLLGCLFLMGIFQYTSTPKEEMPEVDIPFFMITTLNPGTSPEDVENLISRPIEKELQGIQGLKNVDSKSIQDFSLVFIEFEVEADPTQSYLDLMQALDKAKNELPNDLYQDPQLEKLEITEIPICNINLTGEMGMHELKKHAEDLEEILEGLPEISKVDIVGARDREIQVNIDIYRMQSAGLSFRKIEDAIRNENLTMSGGQLEMDGLKKNLRVIGEFKEAQQLEEIILKPGVRLKDVAQVIDTFKDPESFSRMGGSDVVTLNVIKRGGANLLDAIDNVKEKISTFEKSAPQNLDISLTGDSSSRTRNSINNLINTIILGFLVVLLVLMFFMGVENATFAAMAIPLSMIGAFIMLPAFDLTINNITLMGFIIVLGILVDNSIVVVENIHRYHKEYPDWSPLKIVKGAVGEVAIPVLTGTLTTIAPFFPLIFWPGIIGKFFSYIPLTVIITLVASILVAYTLNPVFAVSFLNRHTREKKPWTKKKKWAVGILLTTLIGFAIVKKAYWIVISLSFGLLAFLLYKFLIKRGIKSFQISVIPWMIGKYEKVLTWALKGKRPKFIIWGSGLFVILSFMWLSFDPPRINFMPQGDPDAIYISIEMPEGTHILLTDSITKLAEQKIYNIIGSNNPDIESIISNVAMNAGSGSFDRSQQDKLAKITISFEDYDKRVGPRSSTQILNELRTELVKLPGADVTVDKQKKGPPTGKPIEIQLSGLTMDGLIDQSQDLINFINDQKIPGIENLKNDIDFNKPEVIIEIDRDKANKLGLSTAQIAGALRTSIYGTEASNLRDDDDEYPIQVRLDRKYRNDPDILLSQQIRVEKNGVKKKIPLSAVAKIKNSTTYGGVIRHNFKRMVTIESNVLEEYNANEVVKEIKTALKDYDLPMGYSLKFAGEQEDQAETGAFFAFALVAALLLIVLILIAQFNSFGQPFIIFCQIIFAFVGIILFVTLFNIEFSIIMSGLGVISVGGVVATNGIILMEYTNQTMATIEDKRKAVIKAGATRLIPVLLTASSTILGLLPLASGINIDLAGLFGSLEPNIYFGGPTADFWKPMAHTITIGLGFSTILTLIIEPVMYYHWIGRKKEQ